MDDEHSRTPAPKGFPFLTPISIQLPSIRNFQSQFVGDRATSKLHHNVQPLAPSPVAPPGHISPSSAPPTIQRPSSPARLSCWPLPDRLGQPQTQLVPDMHDETALRQITCNPASHSTLSGITASHSQRPHVLYVVPPIEGKALDTAAEFQMQVDTNASELTRQDTMDLDGGSFLPWRNPFDESNETHSTTISKFRLADVVAHTEKVTEEWSKVERPHLPLPKRRRPRQVTSPTTRAGTKAPLHKPNPRVVAIPFDNRDSDRRSSPPPNVDGAFVSNVAAVPVLEAPALAERSVSRPLEVAMRLQRLKELGVCCEPENGQLTGNHTPNPAVQSCGSPPPILGYTRAVSSLPLNPLGRPSARQHGQLTLTPPLAPEKPAITTDSRQSNEKSAKGQHLAPAQTCQSASATTTAQSTGPVVCLNRFSPSNPGPPISLCNGSGAPDAMGMRTTKETRPSLTAAAPLPPVPPQQASTELMEIELEPSSPKIHPHPQLITVAEALEALTETTGRSPEFVSPATPLDRRVSPPPRDIPLTPPPTADLPSFNVEAQPPPATLEQKTPTTASQRNTTTGSKSITPAPAVCSPSLGCTIPQAAIHPQVESTTMDVQTTQPEQGPFVIRTPPRQPNHTGPMYYSPAAPPPVSHHRRSASPPARGQRFIRARTPPRCATPRRPSPRRWTSPRVHRPSRSHPLQHDTGARIYSDDHMQTDYDGRDRRRQERIDLRMSSYDPHYPDDRPLGGFERETNFPSHESEPEDRTFSSYSRDRHRPKSMETGPVPPAQYLRNSQIDCQVYCEPNGLEWSHLTRRDLETSEMGHQADSSRQRHPANGNTPLVGYSTHTRLDTILSSNPRAGSGPRSAGSSSYPRDVNWGPCRSETLQVDARVSPVGLLAPSVQIEERVSASKRPRESESSPPLEGIFDSTKSISITEPPPKRQKVDTTSSERQTAGDSQTLVWMASYHPERMTTHSLQETPIGHMMIPSTSQSTLADRMGMLNKPSSMRQSPPGPSRGPLISRFSYGPALHSVSQPTLEAPGEGPPPTVTRPLLDRFTGHEESSNQARTYRGARFRGRGGRGLGIPPSEPSAFRHQPLGQRLSGGTHVKNNSLLERME